MEGGKGAIEVRCSCRLYLEQDEPSDSRFISMYEDFSDFERGVIFIGFNVVLRASIN